jgi:hypothetical protein
LVSIQKNLEQVGIAGIVADAEFLKDLGRF